MINMSASKRCMICELHTGTFLANSRAFVRVMGVILAIEAATDDQTYPMANNHREEDLCLLVLDDGTASVDLWTPRSMIHSLAAEPGQTLDYSAAAPTRFGQAMVRRYAHSCHRYRDRILALDGSLPSAKLQ